MGNDMVGQIFDKFESFRPDKTIMKIWSNGKGAIILAVKDPKQWEMEMDPYYIYSNGKVDGISYIDNEEVMTKIAKPENLIYKDKSIE